MTSTAPAPTPAEPLTPTESVAPTVATAGHRRQGTVVFLDHRRYWVLAGTEARVPTLFSDPRAQKAVFDDDGDLSNRWRPPHWTAEDEAKFVAARY